jgi:restriction system protein
MKNYFRIMLGKGSNHANECFEGSFVGVDYGIKLDLSNELTDEMRTFNQKFIPIYLSNRPDKTKIAAGLACSMLWTISKGIIIGDIVLCPDGAGKYHVGEVISDYTYQEGGVLPHRRSVRWFSRPIQRSEMSLELRRSAGASTAVINISGYTNEIESLVTGITTPKIYTPNEKIEDKSAFAMEKHLEDFLIQNWAQIELAREYHIYEEDGEKVGQQYPTDTGPIDILAISKNKQVLLVIELKKGRASDVVVGQILRYMGYVKEELAEPGQNVKGVIIAMEDDLRISRALAVMPGIDFYIYQVRFKLEKV